MVKLKAIVLLFILFLLGSLACGVIVGGQERATLTPVATVTIVEPITPLPVVTQVETAVVTPTSTPLPTVTGIVPTETAAPTPTPTAIATDLSLNENSIILYPPAELYAGDLVTFQVLAYVPDMIPPHEVDVHIYVGETRVVDSTLNWRNLAGDVIGLYPWVWNTTAAAGVHTISVILDPHNKIEIGDENPDNNQVALTVPILPVEAIPPLEAGARWLTVENDCCQVHVVSNTAAHRDLEVLVDLVDRAFQEAGDRIEEWPQRRYDVFLIDRVIGQGGYAGASMVISYLDRDYAGSGLYEVLVHEAVHLIDRQFTPNRIAFLAEGVAVWATGGHYKEEDLDRRAAALVNAGLHLPFDYDFIDNFYLVQHEIAYLQAASFVSYLVHSYGWPGVRAFYSDVTAGSAPTLVEAVDVNLQRHFGRTLAETEADWLDYLAGLSRDRTALQDLQTTIRFYEVMRYYQSVHDRRAYFLIAWLPAAEEALQRNITADLTRRPRDEINVVLETMLHAANQALLDGEYNRANVLLDSVVRVLDNEGAFIDPLANQYRGVTRATASVGYEAQQITISGQQATVLATTATSIVPVELNLTLNNQTWVLSR